MTETTQKDRDKARRVLSDEGFNQKLIQPTSWLISLLNDADRLAEIERQLDQAHAALHELLAEHINIADPAAAVAKRGLWSDAGGEG